jgi:hypothetical protein
VEQQEVERDGEPRARATRPPREVEVVEMEAVVRIGVEALRLPYVMAHGDENTVEDANVPHTGA